MFTKPNKSNQDGSIVTQNTSTGYLASFAPDRSLEPYPLKEITHAMGIDGPRRPAQELIDKQFLINAAKPFKSSFNESAHAYFCLCTDVETGELFTTILGGGAVVDLVDAVAASGFDRPLLVTMRWVDRGQNRSYYVLE